MDGRRKETESREAALLNAIGEVGKWQVKIFLLMAFLRFPIAWTLLGMIFLGAHVPYHCTGSNETCYDFDGNDCQSWTYDRSVFTETVFTEWDLVCSRKHLTNVAQTTFMIGILIGTISFSTIADRFGRKIPLIITGVLQLVLGVASAFVPWYWGFVMIRFLQAVAMGGNMTIDYVICMEVLSGKWRTLMATLMHIPVEIGIALMAVVAYYAQHWRLIQLIVSLPVILISFYWWWVPESPRWLLAVGKDKEALEILRKAAEVNGRPLPEKIPEITILDSKKEDRKASFLDLLRTPNIRRRTLMIWFCWFTVGLNYFGLEQFIGHLEGNIFINVAVSNLCMMPGVLVTIYSLDKIGRKWTLFCCQFIAGLSCVGLIIFPEGAYDTLRVVFATVGSAGGLVGYSTLYLFSAELFPTVLRNTGLGSASMCSRIGSMVAPFVASTHLWHYKWLGLVIFAGTCFISAASSLVLPETLNTALPVTVEDAENFVKCQSESTIKDDLKPSVKNA